MYKETPYVQTWLEGRSLTAPRTQVMQRGFRHMRLLRKRPAVFVRAFSGDSGNGRSVDIQIDRSGLLGQGQTGISDEELRERLAAMPDPPRARHTASASHCPINVSPDTKLCKQLRMLIAMRGPITVAEYMHQALCHPEHGYYMQRDVFGRDGDFTTAPEISQMFGELVGVWLVSMWMSLGSPPRVRLVEMGPGRGTLMSDVLRAARSFPSFLHAVRAGGLHLVEVSPALREVQRRTLGASPAAADAEGGEADDGYEGGEEEWVVPQGGAGDLDLPARWHAGLERVPDDAPLLMVGQEILDAFPIHQFEYVQDAPIAGAGAGAAGSPPKASWRERMVDLNSALPPEALTMDGVGGAADAEVVGKGKDESEGEGEEEEEEEEHYLRFVLSQAPTPAAMAFAGTGTDGASAIRSRWAQHTSAAGGAPGALTAAGAAPGGAAVGSRIEVCPQALALAEELTDRVGRHGGAALLVDYGYGAGGRAEIDGGGQRADRTDTLRGIRDHEFLHPLREPGRLDLSADVDFAAFARAARARAASEGGGDGGGDSSGAGGRDGSDGGGAGGRVSVHGPVGQGAFLAEMGIAQRLEVLLDAAATEAQQEALLAACERLVSEEEGHMGKTYQAVALVGMAGGAEAPPEFVAYGPPGFYSSHGGNEE